MPKTQPANMRTQRVNFWLLFILLCVFWFAGGSARADALGQAVVRFAACMAIAAHFLFASRPQFGRVRAPLGILMAMIAVVAIQLIPLPPAVWLALPGRQPFATAAEILRLPQPWRPISISPSWTLNALQSLVVPFAVLWLAKDIDRQGHWRILVLIVVLVLAGALLGLMQLAGGNFDNPLINEMKGFVSGNFANRNHFALFVSLGCLLVLTWASLTSKRLHFLAAFFAIPLLVLINLATGSRAGLILNFLAIAAGLFIVRTEILAAYRRLPPAWSRSFAVAAILLVAGVIAASIFLGRAESVVRAFSLDASQDLRAQSRPFVAALAERYFPVGSGYGTFDPAYRMVEPDALLELTYLNHAHNDWLELVLEGGIAAVLLLIFAVSWWLRASWRLRQDTRGQDMLACAGSVTIFLVFVASMADYPARTPMIMAILALAAHWLEQGSAQRNQRPS